MELVPIEVRVCSTTLAGSGIIMGGPYWAGRLIAEERIESLNIANITSTEAVTRKKFCHKFLREQHNRLFCPS